MVELVTHNSMLIETIFQLLGNKENDITRAVAWTMKKCPAFIQLFINAVFEKQMTFKDITILYQQFEKTDGENGYTDLEITDGENIHIILEAKRGWLLPESDQLTKYAHRPGFVQSKAREKRIVTLSECSQSYASRYLPFHTTDNGIPVAHFSWKELRNIAEKARVDSNHEQKHLLNEFYTYLGGLMTMRNKTSNQVYVVSLSKNIIQGTNLSYIDVVRKTGHYFCPFGISRWLKEAPNYLGFRYEGKLQSIHHVESYTITKNIHDVISVMPDEEWKDSHFVFNLGPAIIPQKEIRTGNRILRNNRVWVDIDLLLTGDTISQAWELSKMRGQV